MTRVEPADALRVAGSTGASASGGGRDELRSAVVFGEAWTRVLRLVKARRRWSVIRASPAEGVLEVEVEHWLGGGRRPLRIALSLDEVGMTRIATGWLEHTGRRPDWRASRELADFRRALQESLGDTSAG
jgi:hypothetical protein